MFTGLVEEIGTVAGILEKSGFRLMRFQADRVLEGMAVGDSICVDGVCQTVTRMDGNRFTVEALAVTLEKTSLGLFRNGKRVNLERAVTPATRLGGHFVQGHVGATALVRSLSRKKENAYLTIELPANLIHYCVREGSIAIDGVSLTIAELRGALVTVNIIPLTWRNTVLSDRSPGEKVNIEVDIIGRYVARMLGIEEQRTGNRPSPAPRLSKQKLKAWGY